MLKKIIILIISVFILWPMAYAKTKKKKRKVKAKSARISHSRNKYGKRRHHGNGPDLKKITNESNFKDNNFGEAPVNGVNSIENDSKH